MKEEELRFLKNSFKRRFPEYDGSYWGALLKEYNNVDASAAFVNAKTQYVSLYVTRETRRYPMIHRLLLVQTSTYLLSKTLLT